MHDGCTEKPLSQGQQNQWMVAEMMRELTKGCGSTAKAIDNQLLDPGSPYFIALGLRVQGNEGLLINLSSMALSSKH